MLVAAALVPDTVLLLPGTAGRGPDDPTLVALRRAAADAVAGAVPGAARVVVVAPGRATRSVVGVVHAGAGSVGVPDHLLPAPVPDVPLAALPGAPPAAPGGPGTGAVVGLRLALGAGVPADRLHVVEVAQGPAASLRAVGAATCAGAPSALVVVGSGSARNERDAPLAYDERASAWDARRQAALGSHGPAARDALAGLDPALAAELAATGWAPWQVLVGALDAAAPHGGLPPARVLASSVRWGAAHAAVLWEVAS